MKENVSQLAMPARCMVFLLLASIFLILLIPIQPVFAQQNNDNILVYQETFDNPRATGWDPEVLAKGDWNVAEGSFIGHPDTTIRYLRDNIGGDGVLTLNLVPNDINRVLEVGILSGPAGPGFRLCFYHLESGLNHYLYADIQENAAPGCQEISGDMVYKSVRFHKGLHYDLKIGISSGLIYVDLDLAMKGNPSFRTYHDFDRIPKKAHGPGNIYLATPLHSTILLDGIAFYGPPESAAYYLDGFVREGNDPAAGMGIPGVVIRLYGADKPYPDLNIMLMQAVTGPDGHFELLAPVGYDYYVITEDNKDEYQSVQAYSNGGIVRTADWVELAHPAWQASNIDSIVFLDMLPAPSPSPAAFQTPTSISPVAPTRTPAPALIPVTASKPDEPLGEPVSPVLIVAASGMLVGGYFLLRGRGERGKL